MIGRYFKLETFSAHDGDGVRGVIFLSGCPLRCLYCHNPDSWEGGTEIDARELARSAAKYKTYYRRGGVTVSGGEPLVQGAFTLELMRALHDEGLHVALDTAGSLCPPETEEIVREADLILLDLKFATEEEYKTYTGGSLADVLRFFDLTAGKRVWVRIVVVPGINDTWDALKKYRPLLKGRGVERVELLPFHTLGFSKYERLGIFNPAKDIPAADAAAVKALEIRFNGGENDG